MSALVVQTGESFPINTVPVVRNQALGPGVVGAIGSTFALLGNFVFKFESKFWCKAMLCPIKR